MLFYTVYFTFYILIHIRYFIIKKNTTKQIPTVTILKTLYLQQLLEPLPTVTNGYHKEGKVRFMKKVIKLVVLAIVVIFVIMVVKDISKNPIQKKETSSEEIPVILDADAYSRISSEQLIELLGEPKSTEDWNNENSKGTFQMQLYTYDLDGMYTEFILYEGAVVKIRCFATEPWEIKKDFDNVFKMFNITIKDSARKVVDTGITYKFSPVSDTVAEFEVYNFDSEKHTFDSVYITYNLNYFDDPN